MSARHRNSAIAAAVNDILGWHKRIDIMINSAGTSLGKRNRNSVEVEGRDEAVAINLCGLFCCSHVVLPPMRAQKHGLEKAKV